jgi:hypothetical protein
MRRSLFAKFHALAFLAFNAYLPSALHAQQTITGQAAFAGYAQQKPGVRRKITVADLPEPKPSESVDNGPTLVQRPDGAWPIAPTGFTVQLYAGGDAATPMQRSENKKKIHSPTSGTFVMPRIIHAAPNGDLFVADSQAGSVLVLRGVTEVGKAATISTRYGSRSSLWHCVLSRGRESPMDLHRKRNDRGSILLQVRRS